MNKKILATSALLVALSLPLALSFVSTAAAYDCNGVKTSINFQCNTYSTDGVSAIIMYVINFMAIGVGIAVVIGIIFGGITYAQSDGEESKAKEGREIIGNSIIGLFLFIFLYAGANFLVPGGAFNLNAKPKTIASTSASPSSSNPSSPTNEKAAAALKTLQSNGTITNLRDAGASGYIKTGLLYRSANLGAASKSDKEQLATLLSGGTIIDLRESDEKGYKADPSISGVSHELDSIPGENTAKGYRDTFINNSSARSAFADAIRTIASSDGPVLVHCKAGKDRTGWTIALVMMAVGVPKSQALAEYLKSPNVNASWFNAAYDEAVKKAHSPDKTILGYMTQDVSKGGLGLSTATIDQLKEKFKK